MHPHAPADRPVTVGVDTHAEQHVAAALDPLGRLLGTRAVPATAAGSAALLAWAGRFGAVERVGIEGTGSYGAGLSRWLRARGVAVVEVERPKRPARRGRGKSDPVDAEAAARAVLAGTATAQPKAGTGAIESIRALQAARRSAVKARTQAANQLHALVVTAPDDLRAGLRRLGAARLVAAAAAFRVRGPLTSPAGATKLALRSIAVRYRRLTAEVEALDAHLGRLVAEAAPDLVALKGVGTDTAATLLVTAGDNPDRLRSEGSFAHLCGVAPIPASSGKTTRPRRNRGGDRQANRALHLLAVRRLRWDPATKRYAARRTAEGLSKPEILRCLKRYIARQLYPLLAGHPALCPTTLGPGGPRSGPPTTRSSGERRSGQTAGAAWPGAAVASRQVAKARATATPSPLASASRNATTSPAASRAPQPAGSEASSPRTTIPGPVGVGPGARSDRGPHVVSRTTSSTTAPARTARAPSARPGIRTGSRMAAGSTGAVGDPDVSRRPADASPRPRSPPGAAGGAGRRATGQSGRWPGRTAPRPAASSAGATTASARQTDANHGGKPTDSLETGPGIRIDRSPSTRAAAPGRRPCPLGVIRKHHLAPAKAGAARITAVRGLRVTLPAANGSVVVFDLPHEASSSAPRKDDWTVGTATDDARPDRRRTMPAATAPAAIAR
jgi:transposase